MNDDTVRRQSRRATEPQRDPRRAEQTKTSENAKRLRKTQIVAIFVLSDILILLLSHGRSQIVPTKVSAKPYGLSSDHYSPSANRFLHFTAFYGTILKNIGEDNIICL